MPVLIVFYLVSWAARGLGAKRIARSLGNPDSWLIVPLLGLLGFGVLAAASWPWPQRGRGQA